MVKFDAELLAWLDRCKDLYPLKAAAPRLANSPFD